MRGGLFGLLSHTLGTLTCQMCLPLCVFVCVQSSWSAWAHLEPMFYQENGAKETEAGDRKLEEEAAPIVLAQQCYYSSRRPGGKPLHRQRV